MKHIQCSDRFHITSLKFSWEVEREQIANSTVEFHSSSNDHMCHDIRK